MADLDRPRPVQGAFDIFTLPAISTRTMARYVAKLNRVNPALGESKMEFSAADIADVLFGERENGARRVIRMWDTGLIGGINLGTDRKKCIRISRQDFYEFLAKQCTDRTAPSCV